ncbi:MAG TPA: hypothetical protein VFP68_19420 [Burkholderiaceae bacterium]|nr:hypothetical protein [Burkholderiaceae bacterium]
MSYTRQHPDILYRAFAFGVDYGELIQGDIANLVELPRFRARCETLAEEWRCRATELQQDGRLEDSARAWRHAAIYLHFSRIKLGAARFRDDSLCIENWCRPQLEFHSTSHASHAERVFASSHVGYRILAGERQSSRLVWVIGGLDSRKEVELIGVAREWIGAGTDVLLLDLCGQGTLLGEGGLRTHFDGAVLDVAEHALSRWRYRTLTVVGLSLGGHLALRASSVCNSISSAVSVGGFHDDRVATALPAHMREHLALSLNGDAATSEMSWLSLQGLQPRCPVLHVHGKNDQLVGGEQCALLRGWSPKLQWRDIDGAEHVCTSRFAWLLPELRHWIDEQETAK